MLQWTAPTCSENPERPAGLRLEKCLSIRGAGGGIRSLYLRGPGFGASDLAPSG